LNFIDSYAIMISEIQLAKELLTIQDPYYSSINKNIVDTGRVRGINIYRDHVNILIENDKENSNERTLNVKNKIESHLKKKLNISEITIDTTNFTGQRSEVSSLLKMSQADEGKKVSDKWNMDGHKLFWHLDRVEAWQRGERVAPLHIDMGISNGCNMGCTFCYGVIQNRAGFGTNQKKIYHMPTEAVKRTFKDAKEIGVRSIALIGEGENTLHPDFYEILDYGKKIDLDLSLATNGIKLDHSKLDVVLNSLKWFRINISAGTEETFMKIHRVPQMQRVLKNAAALSKRKKELNSKCTIGFQMVVTKDNMKDIVPLAKLGKECGVDYLVVKPCSDTYDNRLNAPHGEYIEILDTFKEAEAYSNQDYTVSIKWKKALNGGWKDYGSFGCHGTQFILGLSGTGNLFPCGHWFNERKDEFLMGNVVEKSFKEIWQSERYWEVQEKIRKHVNVNNDCESNCRQHYVNRFLAFDGKKSISSLQEDYKDHISKKPGHINFI